MSLLGIAEGTLIQGSDESIIYTITVTNWGTTPDTITAIAVDETTDTVVTSTVFPSNSPSATGDVITLSPLTALTKNHRYRIEVKFTANSNVFECYFKVSCEM